MRVIFKFVVLAAVLLSLVACRGSEPNASRTIAEPYRIGAAISLTGQEGAAVYGENIRNAAELARDEINARGGVRARKLEIVYEDTQLRNDLATTAVNKLI